jgi:hypothetical protein
VFAATFSLASPQQSNTEVTFEIVEQYDQACAYLDIPLEKGQIKAAAEAVYGDIG